MFHQNFTILKQPPKQLWLFLNKLQKVKHNYFFICGDSYVINFSQFPLGLLIIPDVTEIIKFIQKGTGFERIRITLLS